MPCCNKPFNSERNGSIFVFLWHLAHSIPLFEIDAARYVLFMVASNYYLLSFVRLTRWSFSPSSFWYHFSSYRIRWPPSLYLDTILIVSLTTFFSPSRCFSSHTITITFFFISCRNGRYDPHRTTFLSYLDILPWPHQVLLDIQLCCSCTITETCIMFLDPLGRLINKHF